MSKSVATGSECIDIGGATGGIRMSCPRMPAAFFAEGTGAGDVSPTQEVEESATGGRVVRVGAEIGDGNLTFQDAKNNSHSCREL